MTRVRWETAAWTCGIASVLLLPAHRNLRMMALFVTLLCFVALRLRPWFGALSVAALAVWVLGVKDVQFGWTAALMVCAGLAAADYAVKYREQFVAAIASPVFLCVFQVVYLVDRANGFSGVGTLDNTIIAGPIFAILSILAYEKSQFSAFAYGYLCFCMESTTGFLALLACYAPLILRRIPLRWAALSIAVAGGAYMAVIDQVHLGYGHRLKVIVDTMRVALDKPILGHGWASFESFGIVELPRTWDGTRFAHAHCDFAQLAYEAGFLALALVGIYLLRCLRQAYERKDAVSLGSLLGLAVFSALGFPWHVAPSAMVGLLVLAHHEARAES